MAIDWEVAGHAIALGGVFINFMRIGEWKARQETRRFWRGGRKLMIIKVRNFRVLSVRKTIS